MLRIEIKNLTGKRIPPIRNLKNSIKKVLRLQDKTEGELNIVFVTDSRIRKLNLKYKETDRPTDVLAFNMMEGVKSKRRLLGDVVISLDAAARQARDFGSSKKKEIYLYIIHGILHLAGYDDTTGKGRRRMQRRESRLLEAIWSSTT